MPWLYYSADPRTTLTSTDITMAVSFQTTLAYYLASYSLNGTFLGLIKLTNQLLLCSQTSDYATQSTKTSFLKFGSYYESVCDFDASILLHNTTREMVFYDMYVYDDDAAGGTGGLYPVPVRVRNFRRTGGSKVNKNSDDRSNSEIVDDVLTRRFFMNDTVSGQNTLGELQVVR